MAMLWALAIAGLLPVACSYDYGALGGRPGKTGDGASGGSTTTPIGKPDGSAGAETNLDGAGVASSGGRLGEMGVGGSGGTGAGGEKTAGVGGSVVIQTTGGAAGSATGGATGGTDDRGGGGGGGGIGSGGVTVARTISIDFVGGTTMAASASSGAGGRRGNGGNGGATVLVAAPAMTATEVAGVKPVAHWNSAPGPLGTLDNLVQSDGGNSSASAIWKSTSGTNGTGVFKNRFADAPGNIRMMNGYLDPTSNDMPATVLISDLPADMAAAGYDVYVYAFGDVPTGTRNYTYAIGARSVSVVQTSPTPTTFSGFVLAPDGGMGNYVIFRNVTGRAFTLTARPPVGTPTRAPVNGMQIVSPPGS